MRKFLCVLGFHFYTDWKDEIVCFTNDQNNSTFNRTCSVGTCNCCGKKKVIYPYAMF